MTSQHRPTAQNSPAAPLSGPRRADRARRWAQLLALAFVLWQPAAGASASGFYVVLIDLRTVVAGPFIDYDVCERVARIMSAADPSVFSICVGDPR